MDVYAHDDPSYALIAKGFNFDTSKIYDGYWYLSGVKQVDLFGINANAGSYAKHLVGISSAVTALCPTYYPDYNANIIAPTARVNSLPIHFFYIDSIPNSNY